MLLVVHILLLLCRRCGDEGAVPGGWYFIDVSRIHEGSREGLYGGSCRARFIDVFLLWSCFSFSSAFQPQRGLGGGVRTSVTGRYRIWGCVTRLGNSRCKVSRELGGESIDEEEGAGDK